MYVPSSLDANSFNMAQLSFFFDMQKETNRENGWSW